jgi:hypothetical protein
VRQKIMKLFKRLLGKQPTEPLQASMESQLDAHAESRTSAAGSRNATRRELIRVLLRDSLRRHGIPANWIHGDILMVAGSNQQTRVHVRLVIRHWDARLLNYAHAFESSFVAEIERFEPQSADWLRSISWQIAPEAGCPFTIMPEPTVWTAAPAQEDPNAELKEDLERLFAIRDLENARHAQATGAPGSDFEPTEPAPLDGPKPKR